MNNSNYSNNSTFLNLFRKYNNRVFNSESSSNCLIFHYFSIFLKVTVYHNFLNKNCITYEKVTDVF